MKLNEIFDTETRERQVDDLRASDKPYGYSSGKRGELGSGKFSRVKDKKSDPFMVQKIPNKAEDALSNDAYYCYIAVIVKRKIAQENPFAPRVYKINHFLGNDGSKKYTIDMEKLISAKDIGKDDIKAYASTLFADSDGANGSYPIGDADDLADKVNDIVHGNLSTNDQLNSLIDIIKDIKSTATKHNKTFYWDLHSGNMMFRRGKNGLQLVITDPLAQSTDYE